MGLRNKSERSTFVANAKSSGYVELNLSLDTFIKKKKHFTDELHNSYFKQYLTRVSVIYQCFHLLRDTPWIIKNHKKKKISDEIGL